jgi:purine-binding chemotaxis protein CheW
LHSDKTVLKSNAESDVAVQAYIDLLLFESDIAIASVDGRILAQPDSPQLDSHQADIPNVSEAVSDAASETASETVNEVADFELDDDESVPDVSQSNPFLKQLVAAQRRGLSGAAAATDSVKVDNRPAWGRENFRCLAFNVSGLKLAVPVQFIEGMQPLDLFTGSSPLDEPLVKGALILGHMKSDPIDGAPSFFSVLDTARLVMPERYDDSMKESYRYVLALKNCDWSIAVDSIGGEIALSSQNVRWRSEHTRREWLAGTVVDKMCALIDIDLLNRQMMADAILMGEG